ncbi:hypothetical protein V7O62_09505 [Methanolobus sp. ZRKC2]|uniref:hypothetical protein n=1 Tax=Methanolobus sp. ZRKC2 TaxID=3125783 RepID=UPI0032479B32
MGKKKIVFVYNADSGIFSSIGDYVHKVVSPSTYGCNLCGLTYGNTGMMKQSWKSFVSGLKFPVEFLHKDEFSKKYDLEDVSFPCAFIESEGELELLINSDEMNALSNLDELKSLVSEKVAAVPD